MNSRKTIFITIFILSVMVITMLYGCGIFGGEEYKIKVLWYPNEEDTRDLRKAPQRQIPLTTTAPDQEKKFRIMEENMGNFDRIIVRFKQYFSARDVDVNKNPGHSKFELYGDYKPITPRKSKLNFGVVTPKNIDSIDWREAIEYYDSLPEVLYAEPDYFIRTTAIRTKSEKGFTPNDPRYDEQWHFHVLNMEEAWALEMGDPGVKVAVLDTGVAYMDDPDNPDDNGLAPDLVGTSFDVANAYDYVNGDDVPYDGNGHGTHVTGTIAQATNNDLGVAGMAPNITILPVKVIADDGSGGSGDYNSNLAAGIEMAADAGAHIINMSLRSDGYSDTVKDACAYAYNEGVAVLAASGNGDMWGNPYDYVGWPAGHDGVIAVGSLGPSLELAYYSNYGLGTNDPDNYGLDIVAPGGDKSDAEEDGVLQNTLGGYDWGSYDWTFDYYFYQGTSMATPHAVGLAALLKSMNPDLTNDLIEQIMKETAVDLGDTGVDEYFSHGMINPVPALLRADELNVDRVADTFEGVATKGTPVDHDISVLRGEISVEIMEGENLMIQIVSSSDEVLFTAIDENFSHDVGWTAGDFTVRVSVASE